MSRRELRQRLCDAVLASDTERVREVAALDPSIVRAPNSHQNAPLQVAIGTGRLDLVKLLISLGADPRHRNQGGRSMMDCAVFSGAANAQIAEHLIAVGLEPSVHHAAAIGDLTLLRKMIDSDPGLLGLTKAGGRWHMTPLHGAVLGGSIESVKYLISTTNIDVEAENHNGHTALALTPECQSDEAGYVMAALLLERGASPNVSSGHHGGTLLHRSVVNRRAALAKLLLANSADPNRRDWSGKTPLHHAVTKNRKLVELLLQYSPDLTKVTRQCETPSDLARRLEKRAIIQLLDGAKGESKRPSNDLAGDED